MRGSFTAHADLAIDLGTAATRVAVRGKGVVLEVPTVVASSTGPTGRKILALGTEAKKMLGKTPAGVEVVRPVRDGLIVDFKAAEHLIRDVLAVSGARGLVKPRLLMSVPAALSEVEGRAVQDAARGAGSRETFLVASPMAAAIGAALGAEKLLLCTSAPGILENIADPRSIVSYTDLEGLAKLHASGSLADGMLPKASAIEAAIKGGVRRVHVVSFKNPDALLAEVFTNEGTGTLIVEDIDALSAAEQGSQP